MSCIGSVASVARVTTTRPNGNLLSSAAGLLSFVSSGKPFQKVKGRLAAQYRFW